MDDEMRREHEAMTGGSRYTPRYESEPAENWCYSCFCGTKFCVMALCLALTGSAVGLGVVFGLKANEQGKVFPKVESKPNTTTPTFDPNGPPANASSRYKEIYKIVVKISGVDALRGTVFTPQRRALSFVADSDPYPVPLTSREVLITRYVLVTFYYGLRGDLWSNKSSWLRSSDACDWNGVDCRFAGGRRVVTSLKLPKNNLFGTIPLETGELTNMEELSLHDNRISGRLPEHIGNLTNLRNLYLQDNSIAGSIPSTIGKMRNLVNVLICDNNIEGSIPKEIGNLFRLEQLHMYGNRLNGILPTEVGRLTRLKRLWVSINKISGSIPREIGNMASLQALYLDENLFSGPVTPEIANANQLEDIRLESNRLTGGIPNVFQTRVPNLRIFYLDANFLTGRIPAWLGQKPFMEHLDLSKNRLVGNIPSSLGNLRNMIRLKLSDNDLTGTIPSQFQNLRDLETLHLFGNRLRGAIPVFLSRLPNLVEVRLNDNQFSGNVPNALCRLGVAELVVDCSVNCRCCSPCTDATQKRSFESVRALP